MVNDTQILNNGYPMPKIGLGVYKVSDEEMETAIQAAIDDGYRAFDTAYFYKNEEALGKALKNSGVPREDLFITTKLWNDHQGYDRTLEYFNRSLDNLGLDYIDLYLIHWPCENDQLYIETYKALEKLYEEGKCVKRLLFHKSIKLKFILTLINKMFKITVINMILL